MAITAQTIIDRVQTTLFDDTEVRWTETELLDYLNAGIKAIVNNKPDAYTQVGNQTVSANSARQTISSGYQLVEINRVVNGGALRQIDKADLDNMNPDWPTLTGTPTHYYHDLRNPTDYYLFPVPSTAIQVEAVYFDIPADIAIGAAIPVDDLYENALYYWTLGYAYLKNTKRGDVAKGTTYLNLFAQAIGMKTQVQFPMSPRPPQENKGTDR